MESLKGLFNQASQGIGKKLPKPEDLSIEQSRTIIRRYAAAIEGNFVAWMGAAVITGRSLEGRFAASENLYVEMKDNHAGMLRDFARAAQAEPAQEDYAATQSVVSDIRSLVAEMSGLKNLTLMATLESTSAVFVPWLAELAQKSGSSNLHYTNVHGEADIEHANQFIWALEREQKQHENPEPIIADTIERVKKFLLTVFHV
jgi:hypothetical protein